jgi:tRNA 5-methylaminomethyl-2-thiouridine biosynthesis bifunctional protein
MAEAVDWAADGTPRSARFGDIYRSATGGLAQARHVFLQGCGLPEAWAGQAQWRILEAGFGLGLNFLATWRAWKDDPARPHLLHFVSIEAWPVGAADLLRSAESHPELRELAHALARQWWGLLPGVHRLRFEGGRVLLTLAVGDVREMLRQGGWKADSVFLDGFDPQVNAAMWEAATLKAVARLCRRGAGLATWTVAGEVRRGLEQCGFQVGKAEGLLPKRQCLRARYEPAWQPKGQVNGRQVTPGRCAVIGGGLAGAAAAASLARRGWDVQVLEAAEAPAQGASALPAGLMAPHQSPDDNLLSRLTRGGVRATLQEAERLLDAQDWALTGVLEHRIDDPRDPPEPGPEGACWSRRASVAEKTAAGLTQQANAWWHAQAGWVKPGALVRAWLAEPGIEWRPGVRVARLSVGGANWTLHDAAGAPITHADLVVVAAALGSAALLDDRIALHAVRGQVSWGRAAEGGEPAFPVNGNGHFIPRVPLPQGPTWLSGSSYVRGDTSTEIRAAEHDANLQRLHILVPATARKLEPRFAAGEVGAWAGIRCASADRRPLVGQIAPGLWVSTAMGSRGLSFAALCGELLAARLHAEPLPLERRLAEALDASRQFQAPAATGQPDSR